MQRDIPDAVAWRQYGSAAELSEAFALTQSVGPVHVELKFARLLAHGFDSEWDLAGGVPLNLKYLL